MKNEINSLITPNAQTGLLLAEEMADRLHTHMETAQAKIERPGGMNYLLPSPVPKELTASILFYGIAAANFGWAGKN